MLQYTCTLIPYMLLLASCVSGECFCNTSSVWEGLALLYDATAGAQWNVSTNWLQHGSAVCEWYGVLCTQSGLSIQLRENALEGTLPNGLGPLLAAANVSRFDLGFNKLSGTLPPEYSLWGSSLERFDVCENYKISGSIPQEYAAWTLLRVFWISFNSISGSLPQELSQWTLLNEFVVGKNHLSGTLPEFPWPNVWDFNVENNNFTGSLPIESMKRWTGLHKLWLQENNFSGELLALTNNWPMLRVLRAGRNSFSGTLTVPASTDLFVFDISDNRFYGTLPFQFSQWRHICIFDVSNNIFTGMLPHEYAAWDCIPDVQVKGMNFVVRGNQFSGALPAAYSQWTCVEQVDVSGNAFTGVLPTAYSQWTAIRSFNASNNLFSGSLPPEYSAWGELEEFDVSSNMLKDALPADYEQWEHIQQFIVGSNLLSSSLPTGYGSKWRALQIFSVANNSLTGAIPFSFSNLRELPVALFDNNKFSGVVPPLPVSHVLALHHNTGLSGQLPLVGMGVTFVVSVCNTSLCGSTPPQWWFTTFVCQQLTLEDVLSFFRSPESLVLHPTSRTLPSCSRQPDLPPRTTPNATSTQRQSNHFLPIQASFAIAAAVSAASGGGALQVSLRSSVMTSKLAACVAAEETNGNFSAPQADVITLVDSPTQLSLPGRLPLTAGAVLGDTLLVGGVPPLVTALAAAAVRVRGASVSSTASLLRVGVAAFVAVWGMLQVPLTAAAVTLLIDARWHGDAVSSAVGVVGLVVSLLPGTAVGAAFVRSRAVRSSLSCGRAARHAAAARTRSRAQPSSTIALVYAWLRQRLSWWTRRRSTWDTQHLYTACQTLSVRAVVSTLAVQLLRDLHAPHRWAMLSDQAVGLLQGVLVGVASSAETSCSALRAVMWCLFAVCAAAAVVAVGARPRATHNDCAFQAVMACWTAAVTLMSAIGYDNGADDVVLWQSIVQLVWCVPLVVWRCRIVCHPDRWGADRVKAKTSAASRRQLRKLPRVLPHPHEVVLSGTDFRNTHSSKALEELITSICSPQSVGVRWAQQLIQE